jgi:hypothetical protein
MTEATPVPLDELRTCRASAAQWLAGAVGTDSFARPGTDALRFLLMTDLESSHAEVARIVVWLDRALAFCSEPDAMDVTFDRDFVLLGEERPVLHEIEPERPSAKELEFIAATRELRRDLDRKLRSVVNLMRALHEDFVLLAYSARNAQAMSLGRAERGTIINSKPQDIPGGLAAIDPRPKGDARTTEDAALFRDLSHLVAAFEQIDALRACAQGRPTAMLRHFKLLDLTYPTTRDEWRACRSLLEGKLTDAGFSPREIGDLLPDGPGDRRRRASMRKRRRATPSMAGS